MANSLFLTRYVGAPQASTSCASGSARQISRTRASGDEPAAFFAAGVRFASLVAFFFTGNFFGVLRAVFRGAAFLVAIRRNVGVGSGAINARIRQNCRESY